MYSGGILIDSWFVWSYIIKHVYNDLSNDFSIIGIRSVIISG